jgi:hypothetical protein
MGRAISTTAFVADRIAELEEELVDHRRFRAETEETIEELERRKAGWVGLVETNACTSKDVSKHVEEIETEIRNTRMYLNCTTTEKIERKEAELATLRAITI